MTTRTLIVIAGSMCIIGVSVFAWSSMRQQSDSQARSENKENSIPSTYTKESPEGRYVKFTSTTLEETKNLRRVIFFYANWCPNCQEAQASIQEGLATIPDDVVIIRANYNDSETDEEEKELAKTYGIVYQHTFVEIDAKGAKLDLWNGGDLAEILAKPQN